MPLADLGFHHRFVPATGDGENRTLLLLHGTGGSENDLLDLGRSLAPGAALLSPRGKVLENGMPRFFRRLAEGVFDEEDLIRRAGELVEFIRASISEYSLDVKNVIALGYSNGANIAAAMLLLHPDVLSAAVLLRPMVPLVPETLPDLRKVRVFIGAGNHDPLVPVENTLRLQKLLESTGAHVDLSLAEAGHGLASDELEKVAAWLAK